MAEVNYEQKMRQAELSDDNKALIERGLMDNGLKLTDSGSTVFNRFLFNKFKSEFVAEIVKLDPPKDAKTE